MGARSVPAIAPTHLLIFDPHAMDFAAKLIPDDACRPTLEIAGLLGPKFGKDAAALPRIRRERVSQNRAQGQSAGHKNRNGWGITTSKGEPGDERWKGLPPDTRR